MDYIKENIKEFSVCNIPLWHNLGYKGKGIKIGQTEKAYVDSKFFNGKVHDPYGDYKYNQSENSHGNQHAHVIHQVAPDADIYCLNMGLNNSGGKHYGPLIEKTIPLIKELGISIISSSSSPSSYSICKDITKYLLPLKEKLSLITSAGNSGIDGLTGYAKTGEWIPVGAVGYNDLTDEIFYKNYSSRGEELKYTCFSGLYIPHFGKHIGTNWQLEGTSFSEPMLSGIAALVNQFFLENAGRTLNHNEMDKFLVDHIIDLGKEGWDDYYGYGLIVLPDPRKIDINKYVKNEKPPIKIEPIIPREDDNEMEFKDTKTHWAKNEIAFVTDKGLMKGYEDGTFQPDKPMTRAEVATVLARSNGYVVPKK